MTIVTRTASATEAFAGHLAGVARPGDRVLLDGPLGAGKTCFVRGFAAGLEVREPVASPSFTLMHEHEGRIALFHQDLYRLTGAADAEAAGLLDPRLAEGVTLVEWADRLPRPAHGDALAIRIDAAPDDARTIVLAAWPHGRYRAWLDADRKSTRLNSSH